MELVEGENARYCNSCEELKSFDCFHKSENGKYGYRGRCNGCRYSNNKKKKELSDDEYIKSRILNNSIQRNYEEFRDKLNQSKFCTKCDEYKSFDNFYKQKDAKLGYHPHCKKCRLEYHRKREKETNYRKKYYQENKERAKRNKREYVKNNKEKVKKRRAEYYQKNKERINKYRLERRKNNVQVRIADVLRIAIYKAVREGERSKRTKELLGCSIEEFKQHLEDQFEEGMTWDNYGINGWHIDHEIPISFFDLEDDKQQAICFHYSNMQPMWGSENCSKQDKIPNLLSDIELNKEILNRCNK